MLQNIKKRTEGFTIIEVLIVLAIAGLIMVIVFFAVPALQRNSRNTRTRDDVGKALSATSDWVTNNSGRLPVGTDGADITEQANLTDGVSVTIATATAAATGVVANNPDVIQIITGARCSGAGVTTLGAHDATAMGAMATTIGASRRSVIALYTIEAAGGERTSQCQGS